MGFVAWSIRNNGLEEGVPLMAMAYAMQALDKKQPGITLDELPPGVCLYRSSAMKGVGVRVDGQPEDVVFDKEGVAWLPAQSRVFFRFPDGSAQTMAISANGRVKTVPALDPELSVRAVVPEGTPPLQAQAMTWLEEGRTGTSSKQMCFTIAGVGEDENGATPRDIADFNRCLGFLDAVPGARAFLDRMRGVGPVWSALVDRWDELEAAVRAPGNDRAASDLMDEILEPFEARRKVRPR